MAAVRRGAGGARGRVRLTAVVAALAFGVSAGAAAGPGVGGQVKQAVVASYRQPYADPQVGSYDKAKLRVTLDATHAAGMYGLYSAVRHDADSWSGAAGVADVRTERPIRAGMEHRVGSVTKTFTATAVLKLVEQGRVQLDAPIGNYLPETVPGARGQQITVRMLLNHTSGIADYIVYVFPSLRSLSPRSLDGGRFDTLRPAQLAAWGLAGPPTNSPGASWSYSNTNYVILGLLLEKVTGIKAETFIDRNVIKPAGLKHTYFPRTPYVEGAHSRQYESLYGYADPPREYSVYNMSWAGTAGALVSTMDDLNRFYRALLTGRLIGTGALTEMLRTVPVRDPSGTTVLNYGLGLYALDLPCGRFWGHDGVVFGAGTQALSSPDGRRQVALGFNRTKYQKLNGQGVPVPHAIDNALGAHIAQALCGGRSTFAVPDRPPILPLPLRFLGSR